MLITLENCKELTDKEIVAKAHESLDYFSCLYLRYENELIRYIQRISGSDEDEARDILQDSFIKIWRNLNDFDPSLKLSSWIYRIVHNETVSHTRKKKSFGKDRQKEIDKYENLLWHDDELEVDLEEKSLLAVKMLDSLPAKYRDVMILKYLEKKVMRKYPISSGYRKAL
jgi:RNA polymerase sigma-70 factor (ECF subfamily)